MHDYQYQSRAKSLRSRGIDVHEFGSRVLCGGCFGEDVLELQSWLADESYYNPLDGGYNGYFGAVTKEALQAWQRDVGIEASGRFDTASKWAYLRAVETQSAVAVATATSSTSAAVVSSNSTGAVSGVFFLAAAVVAVAAGVLHVVKNYKKTTVAANEGEEYAYEYEYAQEQAGAQPTQLALAPGVHALPAKQTKEKKNAKSLRRMTDEELQSRIAPFKKNGSDASPSSSSSSTGIRRPAPARATPRHRLVIAPEDAAGGAVTSRHGTYYGGHQVIERVKQYLIDENSPVSAISGGGVGGVKNGVMEQIGYDMRASRTLKSEKQAQQQQQQQQQEHEALLSGTDLEHEPEEFRVGYKVPVVKKKEHTVQARGREEEELEGVGVGPGSNETVVISTAPVKLHKPARLVQ